MSHNQSRSERSDSTQYRKTPRSGGSNQQGHYQGSIPVKGGGGVSSATSNSSSRSYKKNAGNAQGGQPRTRNPVNDSVSAPQPSHNRGESHIPSAGGVSQTAKVTRASDSTLSSSNVSTPASDSTLSSSNVSTPAPLPNSSSITSDSRVPAMPAKEDASRSFPLQFGSISPGLMHGVQIPARTSSAPPNLDEQKKSQAPVEPSRAAPAIPNPSLSKQYLLKKNGGSLDPNIADEAQQISKSKRDNQSAAAPPMTQSQKPTVRSISSMPMQIPFHQSQVPLQFGGPSPQIQSQALPGASIPMPIPMHIPIGSPPMQQPIFISGLQPHPMQSQGLMYQAQNFNLPPQMTHQLPPQLGSIGLNLGHQYSPQQSSKPPGSSRKAVKITHPDTHEELKFEGSSGPRPHLSAPSQSQPVPTFPPNHPMSFYPNSYNATSMFFPAVSSVSMTGNQVPSTSQHPRFYNQVSVTRPLGSHLDKDLLSSTSSVPPVEEAILPTSVVSSNSVNVERDVLNTQSFASASTGSAEEARTGAVLADSIEKNKAGHGQTDQASNQPSMLCSLTSHSSDAEMVKTETDSSGTHLMLESSKESPSTSASAMLEVSDLMSSGIDAREFDQTNGNLGKKGISGRESELPSTSLEQGETETANLGTSLGTQDASEQVLPSCIGDTLSGKEEKAGESVDLADDALIVGKLPESIKLESANVSESSLTGDGFPVLKNQASCSEAIVIDDNIGMGNSTVENTDVTKKLQIEVRDESSDIFVNDRVTSDSKVAKNVVLQGGKIPEEFCREAEAVDPEEMKETVSSVENTEKSSSYETDQASAEVPPDNDMKASLREVEPDYWDEAAVISTQLNNSKINDLEDGDGNENDLVAKRYSRDFLLKFEEECTSLPNGFEVTSDIADVLVVTGIQGKRDSYPSPGRNIDRPVGGSRLARRPSGLDDDEKWNRFPGSYTDGKGDLREDMGYGTNVIGFRPGQGGNFGSMRNQRAQMHLSHVGSILSGPLQNMALQGGPQRNYSDSDRWQRGVGFQRGLMPSPQTPQQMKHRAENKYEVGKITDEEEAKQRQLKAILNKLTPQNFEKLFQQVKEVNIDNDVTLTGVISQIFDKALMEPTFCEMYADFCFHLAADLPELVVDNQTITFKRLLLNKCQEEFEKREREEEEANKAEEEGESKESPEGREEKRLRVRRRMLGNIRLIGELYKKRMLTERIMHGCINKLLGQQQNPDEENIEALCKLMSTIGEIIDHQKAKVHMDAYFQNMAQLSNNTKLSSRVRFMLKDTIDLRKNKWQQRRKVEGPKKIEEVHRDAAQERHTQSSRLSRAPSMGSSVRRSSHSEFTPRTPSMLSSSGSHLSSSHAVNPQRTYGYQDARMDERHSYDSRTAAVLLPQRALGVDSINLGPQGGLVRGIVSRVQPSTSSAGSSDTTVPGEIRRMGPGVNGFDSVPERMTYGQRFDPAPRYLHESSDAPSNHGQSHVRETVSSSGNREVRNMDHIFDRSASIVPPSHFGPASGGTISPEKDSSDEHLRNKSLAAIKEYYSAKDENEVIQCIKELNAPGFYPSMISIWITDSFERKDVQRNLLTNLLISTSQPRVGIINANHLIEGFGSVLTLLEDAVTDAPRATEFLGRMFARLITDGVVSFSEISRLVHEGGEEPGRLVEVGLAAEVIGFLLDFIESEKGDSVLKGFLSSSSIRLESFKPPGSNKQTKFDKFI